MSRIDGQSDHLHLIARRQRRDCGDGRGRLVRIVFVLVAARVEVLLDFGKGRGVVVLVKPGVTDDGVYVRLQARRKSLVEA